MGHRPRKRNPGADPTLKGRITANEARGTAATEFLFDPFRVAPGPYARVRGRCPRLLYQSPSGILSVPIAAGVQRKVWEILGFALDHHL